MDVEIDPNNCTFYNASKLQVKKFDIKDGYKLEKCLDKKIELEKYLKLYMNIETFNHILDPRVLYIVDNKTKDHYVVTKDASLFSVYIPDNIDMVENMVMMYTPLIQKLHRNKFVHYNLTNESFVWNNATTYSLDDYRKLTQLSIFYKQSPVVGSDIISPLHLVIEMLHSKVEAEFIEKEDFKAKFLKFNAAITNKKYLNTLAICQKYYGMKYGALDYIDYLLSKFCIINQDNYIIKNPVKADCYKLHMDWFSFGIILHNYMYMVVKTKKPSDGLITFITNCLTFENLD